MSNRYMARLVFLCPLRIWKFSKLAQCLVFSVFHEGLQHLPVVGQFMYDIKMECFPLLANDSCPTTQFFSAFHINTVFLLVHLQQVPEVLHVLCTNMHDLQQFPFCISGACDSGVCGEMKGPSPHKYADRQFLERRNWVQTHSYWYICSRHLDLRSLWPCLDGNHL